MDNRGRRRGKFIVVEGLDGAGTTTQAKKIYLWLQRIGKLVFLTREPSDGPIGLRVRLALRGKLEIDRTTLALMFAADRIDHIFGAPSSMHEQSGVIPFLNEGYHVISDRYYLSSLAYQSLDCDFGWLAKINPLAVPPDITIFLDVPVEQCLARIRQQRGLTLEMYERGEELAKVRSNYLRSIEFLRGRGERFLILNGTAPIKEVSQDIKSELGGLLIEEDVERFLSLLDPKWTAVRVPKSPLLFQILVTNTASSETVSVNFWPTTGNIRVQPKNSQFHDKIREIVSTIRSHRLSDPPLEEDGQMLL